VINSINDILEQEGSSSILLLIEISLDSSTGVRGKTFSECTSSISP